MDSQSIARRLMNELNVPEALRAGDGSWLRCDHRRHQPRRRKIASGVTTVYLQCLDCGGSVGGAVKKTLATADAPWWDEELERRVKELREKFSAACWAAQKQNQERESAEWWASYQRHVNPNNPKWVQIRSRVIRRCGNVCEGCGQAAVDHVHHLTYDHLGDELLFELVGVCRSCHRKLHPDRF